MINVNENNRHVNSRGQSIRHLQTMFNKQVSRHPRVVAANAEVVAMSPSQLSGVPLNRLRMTINNVLIQPSDQSHLNAHFVYELNEQLLFYQEQTEHEFEVTARVP